MITRELTGIERDLVLEAYTVGAEDVPKVPAGKQCKSIYEIIDKVKSGVTEPEALDVCKHINTLPEYDHAKCMACPSVKTDSGWGIARNTWFDSLDIAKFFREHGKLPEATP